MNQLNPEKVDEADYTDNLGLSAVNVMYQQTQHAINQWFGILKVMQWNPVQKAERKCVMLKVNDGNIHLVQGQSYSNLTDNPMET